MSGRALDIRQKQLEAIIAAAQKRGVIAEVKINGTYVRFVKPAEGDEATGVDGQEEKTL